MKDLSYLTSNSVRDNLVKLNNQVEFYVDDVTLDEIVKLCLGSKSSKVLPKAEKPPFVFNESDPIDDVKVEYTVKDLTVNNKFIYAKDAREVMKKWYKECNGTYDAKTKVYNFSSQSDIDKLTSKTVVTGDERREIRRGWAAKKSK